MKESLPSFLLVDGNNIIHAWPELLSLHRRSPGLAHQELARILSDYHSYSTSRVVLVFDGRRPTTTEERDDGGMQVVYSASGTTADDLIERLTLRYADKYAISVATDDILEQNMVIAAGADILSSDQLRQKIAASQNEMSKWIQK